MYYAGITEGTPTVETVAVDDPDAMAYDVAEAKAEARVLRAAKRKDVRRRGSEKAGRTLDEDG